MVKLRWCQFGRRYNPKGEVSSEVESSERSKSSNLHLLALLLMATALTVLLIAPYDD